MTGRSNSFLLPDVDLFHDAEDVSSVGVSPTFDRHEGLFVLQNVGVAHELEEYVRKVAASQHDRNLLARGTGSQVLPLKGNTSGLGRVLNSPLVVLILFQSLRSTLVAYSDGYRLVYGRITAIVNAVLAQGTSLSGRSSLFATLFSGSSLFGALFSRSFFFSSCRGLFLRCLFLLGAAREQREHHEEREKQCYGLFHFFFSPFLITT